MSKFLNSVRDFFAVKCKKFFTKDLKEFFVKFAKGFKAFWTKENLKKLFTVTIPDFFRKKETKNALLEALKTLIMLAISMLFAVVVIAIASKGDTNAIKVFLTSPFEDEASRSLILTYSIPLMFTGVAVCIMSRAGQFNMFVEGGFFVGAYVSALLAPKLASEGCSIFVPLFCILVGAVISTIIGYIPAKMKASLGVDEFVSSLMLNYVVLYVILYLLEAVKGFSDPDEVNKTEYLEDYAKLPFLNQDNELSSGFIIALIVVVLGGIFLFKTKWGYEIRLVGSNKNFASYSGINTNRVVVYSQLIGSGLAGFGGGVYMLGNYYRFTWQELPNYGFDGFVIAIMAKNNPFLVPFASLFLAYLRVGAQEMSRCTDVQNEIIYVIQGVIIILFGAKFLTGKAIKFFKKKKNAKINNEKVEVTA